jgi:hypothetical protein
LAGRAGGSWHVAHRELDGVRQWPARPREHFGHRVAKPALPAVFLHGHDPAGVKRGLAQRFGVGLTEYASTTPMSSCGRLIRRESLVNRNPGGYDRSRSVAWPRQLAGDLRVGADVVERASQDCHRNSGCLPAGGGRRIVVVALSASDGTDDEPDEEDNPYRTHGFLRPQTGTLAGAVTPGAVMN